VKGGKKERTDRGDFVLQEETTYHNRKTRDCEEYLSDAGVNGGEQRNNRGISQGSVTCAATTLGYSTVLRASKIR